MLPCRRRRRSVTRGSGGLSGTWSSRTPLLGSRLAPAASAGRGAGRKGIVHEHHAVADKHFVLHGDTLANERVRGDLAAAAHDGVLLNLDERANLRPVADSTAIQVDERRMEDRDAGSKDNICSYGHADILRADRILE